MIQLHLHKFLKMVTVRLERKKGNFGFEATDAYGHKITLDSSAEAGGDYAGADCSLHSGSAETTRTYGARPMQVLLMALGGCSGIDVVTILNKQRQQINIFNMTIEGERNEGKEPALWKNIKVHFELKGNIDPEKARRACALSIEKYCSVAATLRLAGCSISWDVKINE